MKNTIGIISKISEVPKFMPDDTKTLMEDLGMNEKAFSLIMNVTPTTVKLWTSGAVEPSGTSKRLMQIYMRYPEVINILSEAKEADAF